jgi:integrase
MIMNDLFDRYDAERIPGLSRRTQRDYRGILGILRNTFGHMPPKDIKRSDISDFLNVEKGRVHRNRMVTVLSIVFRKAITEWCPDEDLKNPCYRVKLWPTKARSRGVANDEYHLLRDICPAQVQIAMDLAALTPLGQSEIIGLKWQQVHMKGPRAEWVIDPGPNRIGNRPQIGPIPITSAVEEVLKRAWSMKPESPKEYVIRTNPRYGNKGERYSEDGFRALWQRCMKLNDKAGRRRFHFGDLYQKAAAESAPGSATSIRSPMSPRTNSKIFWASLLVQEGIGIAPGVSPETMEDGRKIIACSGPAGDCLVVYCGTNNCGAIYWLGHRLWSAWAPMGPVDFVTLLETNHVKPKDAKEFAEWRKLNLYRPKVRDEGPMALPDEIDQLAARRPRMPQTPRQVAARP